MDKVRRFISDFGNTSSSLLLIAAVVLNQSNETLLQSDLVRVLVVCCFILPIIFLLIRSLFEVRHAVNKKVIQEELNDTSEQREGDIRKKLLPAEKTLRAGYELLRTETLEWSKDMVITDFLYEAQLTKTGMKIWSYDLQYSSAWKGVHGHKKISSLESMNGYSAHFQKNGSFDTENQKPFFELFPKWKKASLAAIDKVVDEIDRAYAIYISANPLDSGMRIRISYDRKKIAITRDFYYDGKELTSQFDNTKLKI